MAQEMEFVFEEGFRVGLRKESRNAINKQACVHLTNLRPTEDGLVEPDWIPFDRSGFLGDTELVTNGNFTSNPFAGDWTNNFSNTYDATDKNVDMPGSGSNIQQALSIPEDALCLVSITVVAIASGGALQVFLGANKPVGLTAAALVTVPGTYSWLVVFNAGGTGSDGIRITNQAPAKAATIDDVSVKRIVVNQWPHPQLFKGRFETVLFDRDALHIINETLDTKVRYPATSPASTDRGIWDGHNVTETTPSFALADTDQPWQFVDFGRTWFACNGSDLLYAIPNNGSVVSGTRIHALTEISVGAIAEYGGRLIIGGCVADPGENPNLIGDSGFDTGIYNNLTNKGGKWLVNGTGWSIAGGKAVSALGDGSFIFPRPRFSVQAGVAYKITYTTSESAGGSVLVLVGDVATTARSTNSTWVETVTPTVSGDLLIQSDSYSGKIDNFFVQIATANTYFEGAQFQDVFQHWIREAKQERFTHEDIAFQSNWFIYGRINGGDPDIPFTQDMALFSVPDATRYGLLKQNLLDGLESGEWGFVQMPWEGSIFAMKQLGRYLVVYGDNGVTACMWNGERNDFEIIKISSVGILGRASLTGDDIKHVFVDRTGDIWTLSSELQLDRVGYREFLGVLAAASLTSADNALVATYNTQRGEYYFANPNLTYVLNQSGLGHTQQTPTSLAFIDGRMVGAMDTPTEGTDWAFITSEFDFGFRFLKTLHHIHLGMEGVEDVNIVVETKMSYSDTDWLQYGPVPVNDRGIAPAILTGCLFRITVTGTFTADYDQSRISYMRVRARRDDKQSVGGVVNTA